MNSVGLFLKIFGLCLVTSVSMGAGFEKSTIQSGKYMGLGGAVTSSVEGAESLYFNPAGLIDGDRQKEFTANLSPTMVDFRAPGASTSETQSTSDRKAIAGGLFYRQIINEKVAIGVGSYTGGGNITEYNDIQVTGYTYRPTLKTFFGFTEVSAGVGYRVNEKLKLGFAWRGGHFMADQLAYAAVSASSLAQVEFRNMTGSNMLGWRLGGQYEITEKWDVGFMYRSPLRVSGSGKYFRRIHGNDGSRTEAEGDITVRTQLPQALSLGTSYKFNDMWKGFFDYSWTNYGVIDRLVYEGTSGLGISDTETSWSDQTNIRLATEYVGFSAPLRLGYVYTSAVTSKNFANPTLAPPGPAHTLSLGSGYSWFDKVFEVNGALDYSVISGSVANSDTRSGLAHVGSYEAKVTSLHIGATYTF